MPFRPQLEVRGLKELARKVRGADKSLARELQQTNKSVAKRVADEVRPEVPFFTGAAAQSVRARATAQRASVIAGGAKAPYYPWLEFGGTIQPKGAPITRPKVKGGRSLFPVIARERDHDVDAYVAALNDVLRRTNLT